MNAEQWQKIKYILEQAIEIAPDSRSLHLNEICGEDIELRREVESLLMFESNAVDLLEESAFSAVFEEIPENEADGFIGKKIGSYRLLRELGAGGMGVVFLAERTDGEFEQLAAVKLLRRGFFEKSARRRFLQERQILARLQHPYIARLLNGGTTDEGTPYLVMEYVEGTPVTRFADEKNLSLDERLDLFVKICEAVSFAHRNLIVHRDLKPDNILITEDGTPKLLDFGIAKLLSETEIKATMTRHQALTPEYASPEQITGGAITTATDIYCLGIVLYELLTGQRPFGSLRKSTPEQVLHAITKNEPLRPSSLVKPGSRARSLKFKKKIFLAEKQIPHSKSEIRNPKSLKGDLDNIVLKALKKQPEKRYSSIEIFAEDIRRFQAGKPVSVHADTFRYRAQKLILRNPLASAAVLIAVISLLGGFFAAANQASIANAERRKAEQRFNDVRRLANSLMFEINEEIEKSPIKARELLVKRTVEYLDKLAADAGDDLNLQSELAASYEKIGDVQSRLYNSNIGDTKGALESYGKALAMRKAIYERDPKNSEFASNLAAGYGRMGEISAKSGQLAAAVENHRQAVEINKILVLKEPANTEARRQLGRSYSMLGQSLLRCCPLDEVLANYRAAQAVIEALALENPKDPRFQRSVAVIYMYLGYALGESGDFAGASDFYRKALAVSRQLAEWEPNDKSAQNLLSAAFWHVGVGLRAEGKPREGLDYLKQALENTNKLYASDPKDSHWRNELADCYLEIGIALGETGEFDSALENLDRALENFEAVRRTDEKNALARRQIAFALRNKADILLKNDRAAEAISIYRRASEKFEELSAADTGNLERGNDLAVVLLKTGEAQIKMRDFASARKNLEKSRSLLMELTAQVPQNFHYRRDLESAQKLLAQIPV